MTPEERLQRLFRGNDAWYGQYQADPETGEKLKAWTTAGPVPQKAWDRHLAGDSTGLGIAPIQVNGMCYWGAIDLDDDDTDHAALIAKVHQLGLPLVVCRSKSGGAHLYVFFHEPVSAPKLVGKLTKWAAALELENPLLEDGKRHDLEIFPKQLKVEDSNTKPNWLNMPYFGGDDTTRYGLDAEGQPLLLAEFVEMAEAAKLSDLQMEAKRVDLPVMADEFFEDGPPCLAQLHLSLIQEGGRNNILYQVGTYLKRRYPDNWREKLHDYARERCNPSYGEVETEVLANSVERTAASYRCDQEPFKSLCKPHLCAGKDFGVAGIVAQHTLDHMPEMGDLIEHHHADRRDPSTFELVVGGKSVLLTPEELRSITKFTQVCFHQQSVAIPMMKQQTWEKIRGGLMDKRIRHELPKEAGPVGLFRFHLNEFLQTKERSDALQDIAMGKPYEEGDTVLFRNIDLMAWCDRHGMKEFTPQRMYLEVEEMGGGKKQIKVAGKLLNVWFLPTSEITEHTHDLDRKTHDTPEF